MSISITLLVYNLVYLLYRWTALQRHREFVCFSTELGVCRLQWPRRLSNNAKNSNKYPQPPAADKNAMQLKEGSRILQQRQKADRIRLEVSVGCWLLTVEGVASSTLTIASHYQPGPAWRNNINTKREKNYQHYAQMSGIERPWGRSSAARASRSMSESQINVFFFAVCCVRRQHPVCNFG